MNKFMKSPLGGAKHGSPESVALREIPFTPSFDLRVSPKTEAFSAVSEKLGLNLPTRVGQTGPDALCLGPDWWLVLGKVNAISLLDPLRSEFHFSIVDVSAQRTQIELEGPKSRHVLEHLWEQDLRENRFVIGSCSQGLMAKAPTVLWHRGENVYNLFVRSSFAAHLWAALVDASVEFLV